ncbi:MAG: hypothetical protein Q4D96_06755 [Propionibacteriaceae bacterium]|nr:hypothetical protein [Propionibacteriaceae bacterium]
MELTGSAFCCEVPDDWGVLRHSGCVIGTAPGGELGFTPNVVLRESRIDQRPESLAAISQANLRGIGAATSGTLVFQVEAITRGGVERRRLWMLTPVTPAGPQGFALCLLTIQELVVADGVVAELTLTMPFVEWHPDHPYQGILETLRVLPVKDRSAPESFSEVFEVTLDQWASARDGAPREDLSVVEPPPLVLAAEPFVFSSHTAEAFVTTARTRSFAPFTGGVRAELDAAGLVESNGTLSAAGFWYAEHILGGQGWTITAATRFPRRFQFWVTDSSSLFIAPHPDEPSKRLFGYCPSNDLFRILLAWVRATPAWPLDAQVQLSGPELQAKIEQDASPQGQHSGDVAEFLRQPWHCLSLTDDDDEAHLTWVHTPDRGDAMIWGAPSLRNLRRDLSVRLDPEEPFWFHLTATIAERR